jgi:hypothetical protein
MMGGSSSISATTASCCGTTIVTGRVSYSAFLAQSIVVTCDEFNRLQGNKIHAWLHRLKVKGATRDKCSLCDLKDSLFSEILFMEFEIC